MLCTGDRCNGSTFGEPKAVLIYASVVSVPTGNLGGLGRNIGLGSLDELHQSVRILLHFSVLHLEAGPPPSLWTMELCSASCLDGQEQLGRHTR